MNFDTIYAELEQNMINHAQGYYNCIPFMGMERLEKFIPGLEQSTYYAIVAGTGVGKSKLARFLFVHIPLMYLENNPDSGVEISIKYFSFEESRKKIILSEISKYLFSKYGLSISVKQLQSIGRYNILSPDILEKVKEAEEHVNSFLSKVDIIDNIKNPTGVFKYIRDFAMTIGTYYDKDDIPFTQEEKNRVVAAREGDTLYQRIKYYKKDNPKHYVIILIDHISLVHPEIGMTQHQAMSKLSSDYCMMFRDRFGFTPVVVQQLAMDKRKHAV